jgi:ATPase subunit of ABC transporter with duplicated ATPase domains
MFKKLSADIERKRKIMICTIQEISKMLGGNIIFEELSLAIKTGDKLAVVGRNGTGKTTLFKLLAGVESPFGTFKGAIGPLDTE